MKNVIFGEITPLSDKDCFTIFTRLKNVFTYPIFLKNNVIILPEYIDFIDFFLEDSELYNDYEIEDINEYYRKSNILKLYLRKQQIEKIRNRNKIQI